MPDRYVFLSYPLSTDSPNPPAIPPLTLTPFLRLANGDNANVTRISVVTHTGTHIDVPAHVIPGGLTLTDYKAEELIFSSPVVLDLPLPEDVVVTPEHLKPFVERAREADLVLFRFGYGRVRSHSPASYSSHCPGFGRESAEFLVRSFPRMRAVGMDVPSFSCIRYLDVTMAAHEIVLGAGERGVLILEDMNLDYDLGNLSSVFVGPCRIRDMDGGPTTIIGRLSS